MANQKDLREAGFSDDEIKEHQAKQAGDLTDAGFTEKEINEHMGTERPTVEAIDTHLQEGFVRSNTGDQVPQSEDLWLWESFGRGLSGGVAGIVAKGEAPVGIGLHEEMWDQIAFGIGEAVSDLPVYIPAFAAGFFPGASAGGAVGTLGGPAAPVTVPVGAALGGVVGGGLTGGFVTGTTRTALIKLYRENPDANLSGKDFAIRLGQLMLDPESLKQGAFEGAIEGALGPVGKLAKVGVKPLVKSVSTPIIKRGLEESAVTAAEISTVVGMAAAMEGEMPTSASFGQAAGMILSFKVGSAAFTASTKKSKKQQAADDSVMSGLDRTGNTKGMETVRKNLEDIYAETNVRPEEVMKRAETDVQLRQSLITDHDRNSDSFHEMTNQFKDLSEQADVAVDKLNVHEGDIGSERFRNVQNADTNHSKIVEANRPDTEGDFRPQTIKADRVEFSQNVGKAEPDAADLKVIRDFTEFNVSKMSQEDHARLTQFVSNSTLDKPTVTFRGTAEGKGKGTGVKGQGVLSTSSDMKLAMDFARINSNAHAGDGKILPVQKIVMDEGVNAADVSKLGTREVEGEFLIRIEDHNNAKVVKTERIEKGGFTYEIETIQIKKPKSKELTDAQSDALIELDSGRSVPATPVDGGGGKKPPGDDIGPAFEFGPGGERILRNFDTDNAAIGNMIREQKKHGYWVNDFRFDFINDLQFAVAQPRDAYRKATGKKLSTEENPGELLRLAAGAHGIAELHVAKGGGVFEIKYNRDGTVKSATKVSDSLTDILDTIPSDKRKAFRNYLVAKRISEKADQGFKMGDIVGGAKNVAARGDLDMDFVKAANALQHWNDTGVRELVESGLMSKDRAEQMIKLNKDYVPFFRLMFEKESPAGVSSRGVPVRNPVKKFKGSDMDILDPIEVLVKNRYALQQMASNNKARQGMVEFNKGLPEEFQFISKVGEPKKPKGDGITDLDFEDIPGKNVSTMDGQFRGWLEVNGMDAKDAPAFASMYARSKGLKKDEFLVYENGNAVVYRAHDADLLRSLDAMNPTERNVLIEWMSKPSAMLRSGTVLAPDFIARATVRDQLSAVIMNNFTVFPIFDAVKGGAGLYKKDKDYIAWIMKGGANSALLEMDRQILSSNKLFDIDPSLRQQAWNVAATPYRTLAYGSTLMENSMRLGQFKRSLKKGEAVEVSALRSRDVALDFHRMGARVRQYNRITTFVGASINGTDRIRQSFQDKPIQTTAKAIAAITLPSIALYALNSDEEWYQSLPAWERANFWHFPSGGPEFLADGSLNPDFALVRVPMPIGYGQMFGYAPVAMLDSYISENPHKRDGILTEILQSVSTPLVPAVLAPIMDVEFNMNRMTDAPIVSRSQESLLPQYQYTAYTTETAKTISRLIGAANGGNAGKHSSPIAIEHYVSAWTGSLGREALAAVDATLRTLGVLEDVVRPAKAMSDMAFVGNFFSRYPTASAQLDEFYDNVEEIDTINASISALRARDEHDEADFLEDENWTILIKTQSYKAAVSNMWKVIRGIEFEQPTKQELESRGKSQIAQEKRQIIDDLLIEMREDVAFYNEFFRELKDEK